MLNTKVRPLEAKLANTTRRSVLIALALGGPAIGAGLSLAPRRPNPKSSSPQLKKMLPVQIGRKLYDELNIFDVMSVTQRDAVIAGASINDTDAFREALAYAKKIVIPDGIFQIANLEIPGNKILIGQGKRSRLRFVDGSPEQHIIAAHGSRDITIDNMSLDGAGKANYAAILSALDSLKLRRLFVTGVAGHSLLLDGCDQTQIHDIQFDSTGAIGGCAALDLVNWTRPGGRHDISHIHGNEVTGRLIFMIGQTNSKVAFVNHTNVKKGEAFYMIDCSGCHASNIAHIGGGSGATQKPNPGNDGIAFGGGCRDCSLTNFRIARNSGHALSINGDRNRPGASHISISNGVIIAPDEAGIAVTDQGFVGSAPSFIDVSNVTVRNPGQRVPEAAFAVFGGNHVTFRQSAARDDRAVKRMTYAFEEGNAENDASHNHWSGKIFGNGLSKHERVNGRTDRLRSYRIVSTTSSATQVI
jgi:hypothetical protein